MKLFRKPRHSNRRLILVPFVTGFLFIAVVIWSAVVISIAPSKASSSLAQCRAPISASTATDRTAPTAHTPAKDGPAPNTATRFAIVKKGDSLGSIALKQLGDFNQWKAIAWLNKLPPPYALTVGQRLILPLPASNDSTTR